MPRNVEIKARVSDLQGLLERVKLVADSGPLELLQDDTLFLCANGRLKLRELSPTEGELIFYQRDDVSGPKESRYLISVTSDPGSLRDTLAAALGVCGRVRKRRLVFLIGNTRVHLDEVDRLGTFVELEVVLADEQRAEEGEAVARRLMAQLGILESQLLSGAYVDMLFR
jgi:adenylate cyclase